MVDSIELVKLGGASLGSRVKGKQTRWNREGGR
jgi:hypothetical protein